MEPSKELYIIRHGEAEMSRGQGGDYQRALTPSGKNQIHRVVQYLLSKGVKFDLVLTSSAKRTMETTLLLTEYIPAKKITPLEALYDADPSYILQLINDTTDEVNQLLIVGHNPTVSAITTYLTEVSYISMKPGMMAKIENFQNKWALVGKSTGILAEVFY